MGLENARLENDGQKLWGLENAGLENTIRSIRYDTRCYINVRSKADMNRLNLPHGDDN